MYGIVSARGINGTDFPELFNRQVALFFRVANIDALKWINQFIRKYEK